jgi:hypothetical protein
MSLDFSNVNTSSQSKDLDPVSVLTSAENRSKPLANQTKSGKKSNPLGWIPCKRIMTNVFKESPNVALL